MKATRGSLVLWGFVVLSPFLFAFSSDVRGSDEYTEVMTPAEEKAYSKFKDSMNKTREKMVYRSDSECPECGLENQISIEAALKRYQKIKTALLKSVSEQPSLVPQSIEKINFDLAKTEISIQKLKNKSKDLLIKALKSSGGAALSGKNCQPEVLDHGGNKTAIQAGEIVEKVEERSQGVAR